MDPLKAIDQCYTTYTIEDLKNDILLPTPTDHKYTRGVLGVVAGSPEYPGAGLLATKAAVHSGVGMVRFLGTDALNLLIHLHVPEAVCTTNREKMPTPDAWCAGSGATGEERQELLERILDEPVPAVLDAQALPYFAQSIALNGPAKSHRIVTPHAGELRQMLTWIASLNPTLWNEHHAHDVPEQHDILKNPSYWAQHTARLTGATVLLKGHTSYIASPENEEGYKLQAPHSWLATAGSGDTLSGIMGSFLATRHAQARTQNHSLSTVDFLRVAASAVAIHHQAAQNVHRNECGGPTPPSVVTEYIAQAISEIFSE
ncbi:ADP-dependent NAD(P)H-hydrate dehydratase [Rothia sp. P13129]|uniref:ADP-dependent NAD(P)H-hydrate dehydratase n=1 Tax=Rothia sp. P13129 TaxID=3402664 RepID=UPI003AD41DE2